jgi:hypothetical protein
MLSNLPSKRWFDSIGICGNSSSVERWHSSQRVGFDSLFPLNPYSSDKQKQEHESLCSLRGDGNCHLTRLKEAEKIA